MRRIDGAGDRSTPVIVVDDAISSGASFREACAALEDEGYTVEGTACLVDFSSRGGRERAEALGYRVAISFNIWDALSCATEPLPGFVARHGHPFLSAQSVPSGLHPAVAARRVAEHLIAHDEVLRPPATFDRIEDGRGGTFVSVRRRHDDQRLARRGFWHFDPHDADPCRDLVLATASTLRSLPRPLTQAEVDASKFAVSFFGPLESVAPAALDFSRYGIVARSRVVPRRRGGALPNTQYFTSTQEQYRHARSTNARLFDLEDHEVFRHDVLERVEPGESWPPYGVDIRTTDGWLDVPDLGQRLLKRAQELLTSPQHGDQPPNRWTLPDDLFAQAISGVAITSYNRSTPTCFVASGSSLDQALVRAAAGVRASEVEEPVEEPAGDKAPSRIR